MVHVVCGGATSAPQVDQFNVDLGPATGCVSAHHTCARPRSLVRRGPRRPAMHISNKHFRLCSVCPVMFRGTVIFGSIARVDAALEECRSRHQSTSLNYLPNPSKNVGLALGAAKVWGTVVAEHVDRGPNILQWRAHRADRRQNGASPRSSPLLLFPQLAVLIGLRLFMEDPQGLVCPADLGEAQSPAVPQPRCEHVRAPRRRVPPNLICEIFSF